MTRRSVFVVVAALVLLSGAVSAFAAGSSQSSFSISPPPIASPVFGVKEKDFKVGAMYLNMESTDPGIDFDLSGYGVDFVGRSAYGDVVAMDFAVGVVYLKGDFGLPATGPTGTGGTGGAGSKLPLNGMSIPISFNLEVQPFKNDVFNVIAFAGPAFSITAITIDNVPTVIGITVVNESITSTSIMYGFQGGVQLGFGLGDLHVDVFGMATNLRGTQSTSHSLGGSESSDIPGYLTTSYGADFMYVPWGLTFSSILQEAKQSDQNGFKTTMYQLSWSRKF